MEITIQLIGSFILFLFVQALFINGIKAASHDDTEVSPSGRIMYGEMILYPLRRFILQHTIIKDYYYENLWDKIYANIEWARPEFPFNHDEMVKLGKVVPAMFDNDIKYEIQGGNLRFYKEYKKYKFSKYIRKPIIQCIICMPSFWGLFTYWPLISYLYGVNIYTILLWIVNTVCLSYVCYLIYKPVK